MQARNSALDFPSLEKLEASLNRNVGDANLIRARKAEDEVTLELAMVRPAIRDLARGEAAVKRLWDLCQLPHYRNISPAEHAHLVGRVFQFLARPPGFISEDWFSRQLKHCENTEGDLDTLSNRISHVRTWTFIANRDNWLAKEILQYWKRVLKRIDMTSRSIVALVENGSCFAGILAEILFAADRSYMMEGDFVWLFHSS